jgi:hypothetical protein
VKSVVIVQDVGGYPQRIQALRDAHPHVIAVTPPGVKPHPHAPGFAVPDDWVSADTSIPYARRCWLRASFVGLAAIGNVEADHYWFIESDMVASQARWRALFDDHRDNPVDCLSNNVRERTKTPDNPWWNHPGTPAWASCYFISACYRLSARAVAEAIRCAVETCECFGELALPSVLRRAGMSMQPVNGRGQTHWNQQTFRTRPEQILLNPRLINHPVKSNTYDVPTVVPGLAAMKKSPCPCKRPCANCKCAKKQG